MKQAYTKGTKQLVDASKAKRWKDYVCPKCFVRVYLPDVVEQVPHFRHWPKEGKPDCDNFFPSDYTGPQESTPRRSSAVEDAPSEPGLVLIGARGSWSLALRLPEISNSELGAGSLGTLQSAHISVRINGEEVERISGLDIRPGVGTARAIVPPSVSEYRLVPGGKWPPKVSNAKWEASARGLNRRGTLFRLRNGECIRLRQSSAVEWGERLCFLAERGIAPPSVCEPKPLGVTTFSGTSWCAWDVVLPMRPITQVSDWLAALDLEAIEPSWKVNLTSVPRLIEEDGTFVYSTGVPSLARMRPPFPGASALLTMEANSNSISARVEADQDGSDCFSELLAGRPGDYTLSVDDHVDANVRCRVLPAAQIQELKAVLRSTPRLRLKIAGTILEPWGGLNLIPRAQAMSGVSEMKIQFGEITAEFRVDLSWKRGATEEHKPDLGVGAADKLLRQLIADPIVTSIRLDAGALGALELALKSQESASRAVPEGDLRKSRYLATMAVATGRGDVPCPGGVMRQVALSDPRLMSAMARGTSLPVTALIRGLVGRARVNRHTTGR